MAYFADQSLKEQKGTISLAGVKPEGIKRTKPKDAKNFEFVIETPKRKWQLNAGSQPDWDKWEKALKKAMTTNAD